MSIPVMIRRGARMKAAVWAKSILSGRRSELAGQCIVCSRSVTAEEAETFGAFCEEHGLERMALSESILLEITARRSLEDQR